MSTEENDTVTGKPFAEFIAELERGELNHDATKEMNALVRRVRSTGRKGTLTLTIEIKPCDVGARQVEITNKLSSKLPMPARKKNLAFTTDAGELTREDPNQLTMKVLQND